MFRMISPRNDNLLVDFTFSIAIILIVSVIIGFCNADSCNTVHDSIFNKNYDFCSERFFILKFYIKKKLKIIFYYFSSLPENHNFMPVLANGHLGFTTFSDSVYMNGFYNGKMGLSHRARIPNYSNIQIKTCQLNKCIYCLDTKTGIFRIEFYDKNEAFKIIHYVYAHRYYNRAIINQIYIHRFNFTGN